MNHYLCFSAYSTCINMKIMTLILKYHRRTCDCFGLDSIVCMNAHRIMTECSCGYVC